MDFNNQLKLDLEKRVFEKLPERILFLNELLERPEFQIVSKLESDSASEIPMDVIIKENAKYYQSECLDSNVKLFQNISEIIPEKPLIPIHKQLKKMIDLAKPQIKQMVEDAMALKTWISLYKPKIEDGHNLGVDVQNFVINNISEVEYGTNDIFFQISNYNENRANMISKMVKFPYIEDFKRAIEDMDEQHYFEIAIILHDLRNNYLIIHNLIIQNIDKLKCPISSNMENLY